MQLVIDCLEQHELDLLEEENYNEKIQFYSEKCGIYENTLHLLKTKGKPNQSVKSEYRTKSEYSTENLCTSRSNRTLRTANAKSFTIWTGYRKTFLIQCFADMLDRREPMNLWNSFFQNVFLLNVNIESSSSFQSD